MARPAEHTADPRILHEIISTVGSSLDLEEVLRAVVRLLTDAAGVHACFVYLIDDGGERLVLAQGRKEAVLPAVAEQWPARDRTKTPQAVAPPDSKAP